MSFCVAYISNIFSRLILYLCNSTINSSASDIDMLAVKSHSRNQINVMVFTYEEKINKLNLTTKITCSVVFVSFLMNVLLGGCGGTANVVVEKPKNTSLITPKLVSIEPRDNAITVKRNEKIVLKFSVPIDPLTLTVNTEDTHCSGTIQISSYNFRNCVRMNLPELENGNKRIVLSPKGVYAAQEFHQIRLSTEIKAINGASLKKNLTTKPGFRTTWSQQIRTQGDDTGFATTVDKDGNVYLAGNTSVSESGDEKDLFSTKHHL